MPSFTSFPVVSTCTPFAPASAWKGIPAELVALSAVAVADAPVSETVTPTNVVVRAKLIVHVLAPFDSERDTASAVT